jgi:hypothetical protein
MSGPRAGVQQCAYLGSESIRHAQGEHRREKAAIAAHICGAVVRDDRRGQSRNGVAQSVVSDAAFRAHLDGVAMTGRERPAAGGRAWQVSGSRFGGTSVKQGDASETRHVRRVLHNGRPERRRVQAGLTDGGGIEIVGGLQAGEQVIIGRSAS